MNVCLVFRDVRSHFTAAARRFYVFFRFLLCSTSFLRVTFMYSSAFYRLSPHFYQRKTRRDTVSIGNKRTLVQTEEPPYNWKQMYLSTSGHCRTHVSAIFHFHSRNLSIYTVTLAYTRYNIACCFSSRVTSLAHSTTLCSVYLQLRPPFTRRNPSALTWHENRLADFSSTLSSASLTATIANHLSFTNHATLLPVSAGR